jgi:hypothetical protein
MTTAASGGASLTPYRADDTMCVYLSATEKGLMMLRRVGVAFA